MLRKGLLRSLDYFSLRYLALRATTSTGAVIAGLVQTFVFARVLSPELFSIFILVGTLGLALWLFDLGIARIPFVRLRATQLQPGPRHEIFLVGAVAIQRLDDLRRDRIRQQPIGHERKRVKRRNEGQR
jgi:hypothetical protein